jgi:hypothetical protein
MDSSVDATVRITPRSLLWSSVLGTAALAIGALPILLWWTNGGLELSALASALSLAAGLGGVCLFVFSVGYRRHGRPVATRAWIDGAQLRVKVPDAWGRLIREDLRITTTATIPSDDGLVVRGDAEEWWDPGRYEVHLPAGAADGLEQRLTETGD